MGRLTGKHYEKLSETHDAEQKSLLGGIKLLEAALHAAIPEGEERLKKLKGSEKNKSDFLKR